MAKKYLDNDGLLYFWQKIKNLFASKDESIKTITRSGTTFTATRADGTTFTFDQQDNNTTYTPASATPKMDGTGAVGTSAKYAREDHVHPSDTTKVDKVDGKGLSTNDYTTAEKTKLSGIATGAEVNVQSDWNVTDTSSDAFIKNKPTIPTVNYPVTSVAGKTGAVTLAKGDVGLGNVDNTADANKTVAKAGTLTTARTIDGVSFNGGSNIIHYGECSTAAATVAKVVNCTGFTLATGAWIAVKFTVTNTGAVANLTLNVNSTGAKNIKYRNAGLSSASVLAANRVYLFVYDGTNYQIVGDLDTNTTYTNMTQSEATTGTATNARTISAKVLVDTINDKIAKAQVGAAMFQGTVTKETDISGLTAYKKGWYWVVATTGTYAGQTCEAGDMIFCVSDYGTAYKASDFSIVQNNLDLSPITNGEIDTIVAS